MSDETAIVMARLAIRDKERAWELYEQITALMPPLEHITSASSDELDEFLDRLGGTQEVPHAYLVHQTLRDRRASGSEPERPHPLGVDVETAMLISRLNHQRMSCEHSFDAYSGIILGAVQQEGVAAGEEVLEILPPSSLRGQVRRLVDRMMAMSAPRR